MKVNEQTGTAVATTPAGGTAVEQIRRAGQAATAERKALREMYTMLEGIEWGSGTSVVKGSDFSPATRAAFAKFCVVTRANPQIHVDLLGGKPYLNAQYYRDKCSADPYFIDDEQINISASVSEMLRAQVKRALDEAKELGLEPPTAEVAELLAEARLYDRLRADYGVPDWATHAYETRIRRYTENAPLEAIARGEIENAEQFIRTVRECNWAGGRGQVTRKRRDGGTYQTDADPIGDAEPAKTARTRSFRRAARNAFSAWFDQFDEEITRTTEIVEAEWEIVRDDAKAQITAGDAVVTGAGEPAAANGAAAQPLPLREVEQDEDDLQPEPDEPAGLSDTERETLNRRLFAALRKAGITGDARKVWARENELPESTKDWTQRDYDDAFRILRSFEAA